MLLSIEHNPHTENPQELFEMLQVQTGQSYLDAVEPDREALQNLQSLLSPNMQK